MTYQEELALETVTQKLNIIIKLKSSGATDRDICRAIGLTMPFYLKSLENDEYIREKIESAEMTYTTELETRFKNEMEKKLMAGDTTDAKWYLERTKDKFKKNDKLEIEFKTIDQIIREKDMIKG